MSPGVIVLPSVRRVRLHRNEVDQKAEAEMTSCPARTPS
jgi:hypothetical protein